jgi:hypothetical protein
MGNIMPIRKEIPQPMASRGYAVFDLDDEANILFPELAGNVHKAYLNMHMRLEKPDIERINRDLGRHFKAMEQVLALLNQQRSTMYKQALESYLTMKLKVMKSQVVRVDMLHLFIEM